MSRSGIDKNRNSQAWSMSEQQPAYWSHRALHEDKRRCLTDMPHKDHTVANGLSNLHAGKNHMSQKAIEENKKGHKPMVNMTWRRESDIPDHPLATKISPENGMTRFFSQQALADAKRRLKIPLHVTPQGDLGGSKSAREARRSDRQPGSRSGSMSARSAIEDSRSADRDRPRSGDRSPTMASLLEGGDEVHSVLSWWGTVRENRDANTPHTSFQRFDIKKRHHTTGINRSGRAMSEDGLVTLRRNDDPKGGAYQGDYPRGKANHTMEEPEHPLSKSRYMSHSDWQLDKKRHANETPTDKLHLQHHMQGQFTHPIEMGIEEGSEIHQPNFCGSKNQYRSNFTLQMHKKKHLAELHSQPLRYTEGPVTPGIAFTPDFKVDNAGVKNEQTGGEISDRQLTSHREMAYCKRFNTVSLKKDAPPGWHPDAKKPQGSKASSTRAPTSREGSVTSLDSARTPPPHPAGRADPWVTSRQIGAEVTRRAEKLASGRSPASLITESESDCNLLHSSHQELAHRKGICATSLRHTPRGDGVSPRGFPAMAMSMSTPRLRAGYDSARFDESGTPGLRRQASGSFTPERRQSHDSQPMKSNSQMEYQKRLHRFQHDDQRRRRLDPARAPIPPTPRSGQWTPAHI